ncbi:unnamed protein product [Angiostrongylus costaricensis]|uniref:UmuC domain-containing protein n=1 Tax=Angiostrongylus costaricensis TaxID=334426 RepID=A0A0R3PHW8_ANGCS|nr:unnamed protein product [Angiostrongylus costaricensis]
MPGFIAKKLCPQLEVVPGNFDKYRRESMDLSMGSLDEAYLDITAFVAAKSKPSTLIRRRFGGECICKLPLIAGHSVIPSSTETCSKCGKERKVFEDSVEFGVGRSEVVREIRFRVEQASGLTCSAGIAPNFMLAKICSDINKPNGQFELANRYEDVMKFLSDLPIRKISGIGRVSEALLQACGVSTVGELLERRAALKFCFSALSQESFLRIALGLPGRPSTSDTRRKSISVERTFTPTSDRSVLNEIMEEVGGMLVKDMADAGVVLDFWKRRQHTEPTTTGMCEASSSVSDFSMEVVASSDVLVSCPICNIHLQNDDRVVNRHVDECLNNSLLLESTGISFEPKEPPPKKRGRAATIENYFAKRERN